MTADNPATCDIAGGPRSASAKARSLNDRPPLQCKPLIRSDYSSCCPRDIDSKRIHHGQECGFGLAVWNYNDVVGHDGDIGTSSTHDSSDVDGNLSPLL